ncbi:2'-5'-RNA ligase [compost metagenome]
MESIGNDIGNGKNSWRIFIAIPLPKEMKQKVDSLCRSYRDQLSFRKWVYVEDYHITVQFLGDTETSRIEQLKEVLEQALLEHKRFKLEAVGLGTFGRDAQPRVLWAGVEGDMSALHGLHQIIISANTRLGYVAEERPYHPHITMARKYREEEKLEKELLNSMNNEASFGSWLVDRIVLYRTNLGKIPMYEEIASIPLK